MEKKYNEFIPCEACSDEFKRLKATVVDLRKDRNRWKKRSRRDSLTGLPNRQELYDQLRIAIARVRRNIDRSTELWLIGIDLDDFKMINDTYGHPVGDMVLVQFARIMEKVVRTDDICARVGGEEFGILPAPTTRSNIEILMHRLQEEVRTKLLITLKDGTEVRATASLGASKLMKAESIDEFLHRVDKALYHAKETGRNRFHIDH